MKRKQVPAVGLNPPPHNSRSVVRHPLEYLGSLAATDVRKNIEMITCMPYPADPLVEPEFVGLSYLQVALIKQAIYAAGGSLSSLEYLTDRIIGRPAQVNLNVSSGQTLEQFLDQIAEEESKVIDIEAQAKELGL